MIADAIPKEPTEESPIKYYKIETKDRVFIFDKKCNKINWSNSIYLKCINDENGCETFLGLIPHVDVRLITLVEE